jgi:hypothetical protein
MIVKLTLMSAGLEISAAKTVAGQPSLGFAEKRSSQTRAVRVNTCAAN